MQIVIDISEDDYIKVQDGRASVSTMRKAIKNGTPLPKGHGALKDADAILWELSAVWSRPVKSQLYIIREAPAIIEADKAESEDEE